MNLARFALRPLDTLRAWHARYGNVLTVRLTVFGTDVYVAHPEAIGELFTGDQSDLLAGEANSFMQPVIDPQLGARPRRPGAHPASASCSCRPSRAPAWRLSAR